LMTWLKNFLHYHKSDKSDEVVENQPKNVHGKIHLSNCRGLGPSYRMIPKVVSWP
jgi:paired amphipathic helix protein Sin3a